MSKNRLIKESEATGKVKQIFEEIKALLALPFVPQVFRVLGDQPEQLESVWNRLKDLVSGGVLDARTQGMAALAVSSAGECPYFSSIFASVLKRLGATDRELEELTQVAALIRDLNRLALEHDLEPEF